MDRRTFLRGASATAAAAFPAIHAEGLSRILTAGAQAAGRSAESLAAQEIDSFSAAVEGAMRTGI